MSIYEYIAQRLNKLGIEAEVKPDGSLQTTVEDISTNFRKSDEWERAFIQYRKARSSNYDTKDLVYSLNNSIEIPLTRLDPDIYKELEETVFEDAKGSKVAIRRASLTYSLAHFGIPPNP